nr:unnamed protein product [Trichobilharzia regenti]
MPLHFAVMSGSPECVKVCISALQAREDLDRTTEFRRKNFMGKDALTLSIENSDYESFSLLLDAGAQTDYRCMDDVPPLVAALNQCNLKLTTHVLDVLEISFDRLREYRLWCLALHTDLSISLAYFKLLKAHAAPYHLNDFEEIYDTVLEKEPSTKGIEEFLIFLGLDAVERWSICSEEIFHCLLLISSYFLRKLIPFNQNFSCVHRLQSLGLYIPPVSARAWLRILSQWGLPKIFIKQPDIQKQLIWDLADINGSPKSTVHNRFLLPLVLYFAVLALRFPYPDWTTWWHEACLKANFNEQQFKLGTLLEVHKGKQSKPVSEFFWRNIFTFVISRAVLYNDSKIFCLSDTQNSIDEFLNHSFSECPALKPISARNHETLVLQLLSYFPASSIIPGHELFLYIAYHYFLPFVSDDNKNCMDINCSVLITATVHVISHHSLLNLIVNFSARMGLMFLSNLKDWPRFIPTNDKITLLNMLISCYVESNRSVKLPQSITQLLPITPVDHRNYLDDWLNKWLSQPKSLSLWSKIVVRNNLRNSREHCTLPKRPINDIIKTLPLAPTLQEYLANNEYA